MRDAAQHPYARLRGMIADVDGIPQPAPAPRLSKTRGRVAATQTLPSRDARSLWMDERS